MLRQFLQRSTAVVCQNLNTSQPVTAACLTAGRSTCLSQSLHEAILQTQTRFFQTSPIFMHKMDTRRYPPNKEPSKRSGRWVLRKKLTDITDYTTEPIWIPKNDGRGPNGRIWNHRRGGGIKRPILMMDFVRGGTSESPILEKVDEIKRCHYRSADVALVAGGERKRYIVATQNMKVGDIIQSSTKLTKTAVRASEGDSHPLGSLPIGTLVSCIEAFPGKGAVFARSAGVTAQLVRKMDDKCVVRLPSKREICVASTCTATVGRVSNINHNKRIIGKAGANRLLGIRPKSGRWHRKDGRFGRKIKGPKPMKIYDKPYAPKPEIVRYFSP